ncbi:hypothetical protein GB937_003625 [Aspergillus fischeri]|nr:hypothetical protein GB937_003625 [Aspergillus fischeri]
MYTNRLFRELFRSDLLMMSNKILGDLNFIEDAFCASEITARARRIDALISHCPFSLPSPTVSAL